MLFLWEVSSCLGWQIYWRTPLLRYAIYKSDGADGSINNVKAEALEADQKQVRDLDRLKH